MQTGPVPAAHPIVLDCDPGHDDAVAILLAAGDPGIDLLGITTVAGNQSLDLTTHNACVVATVAGLDVPVVPGCDRPLLRPLVTAGHIHGDSGLDGPAPIAPTVTPIDGHAVDFLARTVMERPGEVTLVAVGPLTNVALAARRHPGMVAATHQVVIMGGVARGGNVTPTAEFNIHADPEAAAVVFGEPWPVTMMGLDLTHQAVCTPAVQDRIRGIGTASAHFVDELMAFYGTANRAARRLPTAPGGDDPEVVMAGGPDQGPPVHDPCAVAYVIDPTLVRTMAVAIGVETAGTLTAGTTVVDERHPNGRHCIGARLEADRFWDTVVAALCRLG